ncbi:MAG TPA: hypothetical protein VL242_40625 [Sorangium sp.]|nr:hypothetical protein [Sorangium sp.]
MPAAVATVARTHEGRGAEHRARRREPLVHTGRARDAEVDQGDALDGAVTPSAMYRTIPDETG